MYVNMLGCTHYEYDMNRVAARRPLGAISLNRARAEPAKPKTTPVVDDGTQRTVLRHRDAPGSSWWSELEIQMAPFQLSLFVGRAGTTRAAQAAPAAVLNGRGLLRFGLQHPSKPHRCFSPSGGSCF